MLIPQQNQNTQVITIPYTPRPLQQKLHAALDRYRFATLVCHRRFGKALALDTKIPTPNGYTTMGQLQPGDTVFAADGSPTRVKQVSGVQLGRPCFRVVFSDGTEVVADADHLWFTQTKADRSHHARTRAGARVHTPREGSTKTTAEIAATLVSRGESNHSVPTAQPAQYPEQELPIDPYLLGIWLGNGTARCSSITTMDEDTIEPFRQAGFYVSVQPHSVDNGSKALIYSVHGLKVKLRKAGVLGAEKRIPEMYLRGSVAQRKALLSGLLDSDGHIAKNGNVEFTQKRKHITDAAAELLASLGAKPSRKIKTVGGTDYYAVRCSVPFNPFRLPRKAAEWERTTGSKDMRFLKNRYIVACYPVPSVPVQCIEVEHPSHLFLCTENYIPTHNSVFAVNHSIKRAIQCSLRAPRYGYVAPTYAQAKTIAWSYLKYYTEAIPGTKYNETELRAILPGDREIRLFGADNPDSLRGAYFDGLILDEYGVMKAEIETVVLPALADRQGWLIYMGTPNGRNQFYEKAQQAMQDSTGEWLYAFYPVSTTKIIPDEELARLRATMTPAKYAQEMECSFDSGIQGAIYGDELHALEAAGRLTSVPYDIALPVYTGWDLGIGDATTVWFAQQTAGGGEVRIIDYYEATGQGLPHYKKMLDSKPYIYAEHFGPHDIEVRELTSGRTRSEVARDLGLRFTTCPRHRLEDGIHAARMLLSKSWFDQHNTKQGYDALKNYVWRFNPRLNEFAPQPEHNWASHGADGYRTLAMMLPQSNNAIIADDRVVWNHTIPYQDFGAVSDVGGY